LVELNRTYPFIHRRKPVEASHADVYKRKESDVGAVSSSRKWTNRLEHPVNMGNYDKWANDPESSIAFNVLTDIIAGVGYYTEMPEGQEEHKNKEVIDKYGEDVNLDEDLQQITMTMLQKGFCPVERLDDYDLKILPPETFYIYQDKKGKVLKYTQEYTPNSPVAEWKTEKEMKDIILFFHRKTTSWSYGKSLTESIGTLLDEREQMNQDMPKAIHRWAYPIPVIASMRSRDKIQKAFTDREIDEAVFIGNVKEGEFKMDTLGIDPQARFIPYIELIYYQICEGLHAPLLLYLKNATEASATVMMESVDRLTGGIQRYIKRRVERFLFEPQVGEPVPRLVWGQPKTGLEDKTLADVVALYPHLAPNQGLDLLKQFGIELPDPEWPKQPQLPMQPFQKQPVMPSMEEIVEKLNDLDTGLNVIEQSFHEKKIGLVKAMKMGQRTIDVNVRRMFPKQEEAFTEKRNQEYEKWAHRLIGAKKEGQVYSVHVSD